MAPLIFCKSKRFRNTAKPSVVFFQNEQFNLFGCVNIWKSWNKRCLQQNFHHTTFLVK